MRYLRFIFGLISLCFILASPAMGDVYSWTMNFTCGSGAYFKFSNVKNTYSGDIDHRFSNGSSINLTHKPKSYNAVTGLWVPGQIEGNLDYASGTSARVWMQYDTSGTSLDGWGSIGASDDCELSGTRTAMNASTKPTSTSTTPVEDRTVCYMALDQKIGTWDHADIAKSYVRTAKARGYSPQDCARILGRTTTTVASYQAQKPSYKSYSDLELCSLATDPETYDWKTAKYEKYIYAAQSRGLSLSKCDMVIGRDGLRAAENYDICFLAISANTLKWDQTSIRSQRYVHEAKHRNLEESDCRNILNGLKTAVSQSRNPMSSETVKTDKEICKGALKHQPFRQRRTFGAAWDNSNPYFKGYVEEAKNRGFTERDCAHILDRSTAAASNSNIAGANDLKDRLHLQPIGNKIACEGAFEENSGPWSKDSNSGLYVRNAQSRGLTEQDCARILGRTITVDIKSDTQPTQALVKRTQEALKSLGLYRGKIDGVIGIQSRSALKLWQKTAGVNITGKIDYSQIAQLETDALKQIEIREDEPKVKGKAKPSQALTKREEERKAKAKRLAEANRIKNPDAIAVIIGNRDYEGRTPDVDFAGNDADAMRDFVLNKLGYRSGNIIDLRDATQAKLRDTFGTTKSHKGRLFDYVRADESDVIVFYSGHGVPGMSDKRGYLLSVDANPNRAELTGYPVDTLLKNLSKIPAKSMTVFIDACFSGDSPKGMIVKSMSGLMVEIRQPKKTGSKMVVLTASRGDEAASWDEEAKHGLFTKHLLQALNGAADKQSKTGNKDGKVTLGEVKAYLDREMTYQARRRFSRDQHATVSGDLKTVLSAY